MERGHLVEWRAAIAASDGKVLGGVKATLNTANFCFYLLSARSSGATVVVLTNTGADLSNALNQTDAFSTDGQPIFGQTHQLSQRHQLSRVEDRAWSDFHAIMVLGSQRRNARRS